jgi:hypothetical protein
MSCTEPMYSTYGLLTTLSADSGCCGCKCPAEGARDVAGVTAGDRDGEVHGEERDDPATNLQLRTLKLILPLSITLHLRQSGMDRHAQTQSKTDNGSQL